jgi:hypothetical protein
MNGLSQWLVAARPSVRGTMVALWAALALSG